MNLSEITKKLLKNFQNINSAILIKATPDDQNMTRLRVLKSDKLVYAEVLISEKFEHNVALYNLPMFLNLVNGMSDPDIEFNETHALLKKEKSSSRIMYASEDVIMHPKKDFEVTGVQAEFDLNGEAIKTLLDAAKIMNLNSLKLFSKDGKTYFQAIDPNNDSSNTYEIEVPDVQLDSVHYFDTEFLTVLYEGDYRISITPTAGVFEHATVDTLRYIIAQKTDVND